MTGGRRGKPPLTSSPMAIASGLAPAPALPLPDTPEPLAVRAAPSSKVPHKRKPAGKARTSRPRRPAPRVATVDLPRVVAVAEAVAEPAVSVVFEPVLMAEAVFPAPATQPLPVAEAPTPAMVEAASKPLPRSAAITPWRKAGPLDTFAYWLRKHAWRIAVRIAPKTPRKATVAQLRAENAALRRQLSALRQAPA